jgi:hypothetical protein
MSERNDDPRLSLAHVEVFDGVLEVDAAADDTPELDAAFEELRFRLGLLDNADLCRAFDYVRPSGVDPRRQRAEAIALSVLLERFANTEKLAEAQAAAKVRVDRETDALIERDEIEPECGDFFPEEWA